MEFTVQLAVVTLGFTIAGIIVTILIYLFQHFKDRYDEINEKIKRIDEYNSITLKKCNELINERKTFLNSLDAIFKPLNHTFFDRMVHLLEFNAWEKEGDYETNDYMKEVVHDLLIIKLSYWLCGTIELFKSEDKFNQVNIEKFINELVERYKRDWQLAGLPLNIVDAFNKRHDARAMQLVKFISIMIDSSKEDMYNKKKYLDYNNIILDETIPLLYPLSANL